MEYIPERQDPNLTNDYTTRYMPGGKKLEDLSNSIPFILSNIL